ncbi:MAG: DUF4287 domain-containing protein [Ilumatobacteraceae bacterium]
MSDSRGDRERYFPAIERQHGGPISMWLERLAELGEAKYPEQIAYLRENHAFSRTHANALVMYFRNSPTSRRFTTPEDYFDSLDAAPAAAARAVFRALTADFPDLEPVIAWNHPMLRTDGQYVIGLSAAARHLLLNPFSGDVLAGLADELRNYVTNKHTVRIPLDWEIDHSLLRAMITARLAELADVDATSFLRR